MKNWTLAAIILSLCFYAELFSQQKSLVLINSFPDPESEKSEDYLIRPFYLVVYNNKFYVADAKDNCIKMFDLEGNYISRFGVKGRGPGELLKPYHLAVDREFGHIYVYDEGNRRISCFSHDGNFINNIITSSGSMYLKFNNDKLYSSSINLENCTLFSIYDRRGKLVKSFGEFFDDRITNLSYGSILYSDSFIDFNRDTLYISYGRIPIIQVYSTDASLLKTISISDKKIHSNFNKILNESRTFKDNRIKAMPWSDGLCVTDQYIYCNSPVLFQGMLVLDHSGEIKDIIHFEEKISKKDILCNMFITKNGNNFIFVNPIEAKINIFQIIQSSR